MAKNTPQQPPQSPTPSGTSSQSSDSNKAGTPPSSSTNSQSQPVAAPAKAKTSQAFPSTPPPNPATVKKNKKQRARSGGIPAWTWWIVAILLVGIGGFFLFFWKGTVTITTSPDSAAITFADATGVGSLEQTVAPGTYHVSAEAAGFIPFSGDVDVGHNEQKVITLELRALPNAQRLSRQRTQFMVLDQERESLLYLEPTAQTIYRLFLNDLADPPRDSITPARLENIEDFLWSPDRQLAFYRVGGSLRQYDFNRYDLVNQEIREWPDTVQSIDWRPDGEKVAYFFRNDATGERTLVRDTKDNDDPERIFNFVDTAITDPEIAWSPDSKTIAILENNVFLLDVFTKELTELGIDATVDAIRWSPTNNRLLYQTDGGTLGTVTTDGTVTDHELEGPISRAVFTDDGTALIHAAGRGNSVTLNRISLEEGNVTPYYIAPQAGLAPDNLLLSTEQDRLFFSSAGQIYTIELDDGSYPDIQ